MATNLRPLPPPLSQPMTDENGIVTAPWGDFFNNIYRYQLNMAESVDDATYTLGLGSTDGEVTITSGVITAVTEVVT